MFYDRLHADERLRRAIQDEFVSLGYTVSVSGRYVMYRQSTGGLFPVRSSGMVRHDGRVSVSAWRSKWHW